MPEPPDDAPEPVEVKPGDPIVIPAADVNRMAGALERLARMGAAPPLSLSAPGAHGRRRRLTDATPRGFWALLSGAVGSGTSPYSWTESVRQGTAWVVGPRSGTTNAVEVNARSGQGGKIVRLSPCGSGEYCFYTKPAGSTTLVVTVRNTCNNGLLSTASIVASQAGQSNVSCTTNTSGVCTLTLPVGGTWTLNVTRSGFFAATQSVSVTASSANTATVLMVPTTSILTVNALGCRGLGIPGAIVTATLGGDTRTGTTDASGKVSFSQVATGTWNLSVNPGTPRFDPATGTVSVTCQFGGTANVQLVASSGYRCVNNCDFPVSKTLFLTDPYGTIPINWTASSPLGWSGCQPAPASFGKFARYEVSDGTLTLNVYTPSGSGTFTCPGPWTPSASASGGNANIGTCPPSSFAASWTITNANIYGDSNPHTITLSE